MIGQIWTFYDNIFDHIRMFLSIIMTWLLTLKDHHIEFKTQGLSARMVGQRLSREVVKFLISGGRDSRGSTGVLSKE